MLADNMISDVLGYLDRAGQCSHDGLVAALAADQGWSDEAARRAVKALIDACLIVTDDQLGPNVGDGDTLFLTRRGRAFASLGPVQRQALQGFPLGLSLQA